MTGKLKDYQVLDVLCGGTFYKVRHKVTNNIFAWKAFNCSAYSDEEIQKVVEEVKTLSKVHSDNLLRYYDTILHSPSKTLYFVLDYNSWQSVEELLGTCKATDKYLTESFIWHLLRELAKACKIVENLEFKVLRKCISPTSIFVNETCELQINCFDMIRGNSDLMRQVGEVMHALCYRPGYKIKEFHYSDDLEDVVSFLTDDRSVGLRPDVVLYHPTVLANLETVAGPTSIAQILVSADYCYSDANKCDSEKAVELSKAVEPFPRKTIKVDSPIYSNVAPRKNSNAQIESEANQDPMSPTLAALALELPGFVPRSRKPLNQAIACAQKVSEDTFSQQWMSRLIALRQREESLNQRERDIIAKEIAHSPATKAIKFNDSLELEINDGRESNGITLPPVMAHIEERNQYVSRRRQRRSGSVRSRGRRKSYAYEDMDSSLSADNGDGSIIVTATKFTKENMPRRNIFPDNPSKKVHFTPVNPFAESDESVTLTFYELDNVDHEGYQLPRSFPKKEDKKDITKFKYLDIEKVTSEKRTARQQWNHSSPSKQPKINEGILSDITNHGLRKTPSKTSLTSKGSNTSRYSLASTKSMWSTDSGKCSESYVSTRTRSSTRQSIACPNTPNPEVKKSKVRKSLLPFKTPFKFKTSNKV